MLNNFIFLNILIPQVRRLLKFFLNTKNNAEYNPIETQQVDKAKEKIPPRVRKDHAQQELFAPET